MVERPGGCFFRFLTWTVSCLVAIGVEARSPHPQLESESELAAAYALVAGAKIKVGQAVEVDGDIHSNDSVDLKRDSTVRGDVSAVREVKNQGGLVTGSIEQHVPALTLPATPSKNEALAQANRRLTGPVKLIHPIVDDVLFVSGAVTIEGEARGGGTLIATGPIVVVEAAPAPPTGGPGSPAESSGRRLSILTFADLTHGATIRAACHGSGARSSDAGRVRELRRDAHRRSRRRAGPRRAHAVRAPRRYRCAFVDDPRSTRAVRHRPAVGRPHGALRGCRSGRRPRELLSSVGRNLRHRSLLGGGDRCVLLVGAGVVGPSRSGRFDQRPGGERRVARAGLHRDPRRAAARDRDRVAGEWSSGCRRRGDGARRRHRRRRDRGRDHRRRGGGRDRWSNRSRGCAARTAPT